MIRLITALILISTSLTAEADLRVFACEPEWAELAKEIGQDKVTTYSATTALQDQHHVQARPSLIAKIRRADLVVCSGAQLEIGWLPVLFQKANNRKVLPGTPGYLEASRFVERLGEMGNTDRAAGDVHPMGNPHIQTDPRNIALVANVLARRMSDLDGTNAALYQTRAADFSQRWSQAIEKWEAKAKPLKGRRVITHHKSWVYLEHWLGLVEVANLEAVPGVPPTAGHLSQLVRHFKQGGADFIVRAPYQDARPSHWLAKRIGLPAVELPLTVGGSDRAIDLFSWFDDIIDRLLGASK